MNIKKMFLSLAAMLAFTATANAGEYQNSTPAVQGYDVVSYHTGKRPI